MNTKSKAVLCLNVYTSAIEAIERQARYTLNDSEKELYAILIDSILMCVDPRTLQPDVL